MKFFYHVIRIMNKYIMFTYLTLILSGLYPFVQSDPTHFQDNQQQIYGDIIYSSIVFRNGDRGKIYSYPMDQLKTILLDQGGMQVLVEDAKQRARQLLYWLYARYAILLEGRSYDPKFFEAHEEEVGKTTEELFLAGVFASFEDKWSSKRNDYEFITTPLIPPHGNNVFCSATICPRYDQELIRSIQNPEILLVYEYFDANFLDSMEKFTGVPITRSDAFQAIFTLYGIYDNLLIQQTLNVPHPQFLPSNAYKSLQSIEKLYLGLLMGNGLMKRLKGGPLITHIIKSMKKKLDNDKEFKEKIFQVYSGLDITLPTLLYTLGVYDGTPLPNSAAVLIELRRKGESEFVTISYRKSEHESLILLELPNCKNPCEFQMFTQATSSLTSGNWFKLCNGIEEWKI